MRNPHFVIPAGPSLTRRTALVDLGAAIVTLSLRRSAAQQLRLDRSQIEQILKPLLTTQDPQLWQFVVDVYERCIFGRMQPAEPPYSKMRIAPWDAIMFPSTHADFTNVYEQII